MIRLRLAAQNLTPTFLFRSLLKYCPPLDAENGKIPGPIHSLKVPSDAG